MTGPGLGALAFAASDSTDGAPGPVVEAPAPEPSPPADPPKDAPKEQPAAEEPAPEMSPPQDPPAPEGGALEPAGAGLMVASSSSEGGQGGCDPNDKGGIDLFKFENKDGKGDYDSHDDKAMKDVVFTLTGPNGYSNHQHTDSDGKASWKDLAPGDYTLTETVPNGYTAPDGDHRHVTVVKGETESFKVSNVKAKLGSFEVTKYKGAIGAEGCEEGHSGGGNTFSGVTFTLTGPGGYSEHKHTGSDGKAKWENLVPGDYTLTEDVPDGYYAPAGAVTHVTVEGDKCTTLKISNEKTGSIEIVKYNGAIGTKDDCDEGDGNGGTKFADVGFTLTGPGGYSEHKHTGSDGKAKWEDLVPGDYTLTEDVPGGYYAPAGDHTHFKVESGKCETAKISNLRTAKVEITKYDDANNNKQWDDGEAFLDRDFKLVGTGGTFTGSTGADGKLTFDGLVPGTYTLTEENMPSGWIVTADKDLVGFSLDSGDCYKVSVANFLPATINVFKFNDVDDDGEQALSGEDPMAGINFTLEGPGGPYTGTTDADGKISFTGLVAGTYTLSETLSGWFVKPTMPFTITVAAGDVVNQTVCNTQYGKIVVKKFNDLNGDGVKNGDEQWISQEFTLTGADKSGAITPKTGTTAGGDGYEFTDLRPGTYQLAEVLASGWFQTTDVLNKDIVLAAGGTTTIEVGNTQYGDLNGMKFNDLNGDGLKGDEPPLGGWRIVLFKLTDQRPTDLNLSGFGAAGYDVTPVPPSGYVQVADTLTAADGSYSFGNLTPGMYFLAEVLQEGWTRTVSPLDPVKVEGGTSIHGLDFGNWIPFIPFTPPDLGIEKSVSATVVDPGQEVVYTLKYFNDGAGSATDFVIVDDYDEVNMDVVNAAGGTVSGGKITWNIAGPLAPGASATITYRMRVKSDVEVGTLIDNTATISIAELSDPTMGDNTDKVRISVGEPFLPFTGADVTLLLLAAAALALAGVLIRRSAHRQAA
jgi:uncharacterized repeat protein (TIGR01451 family)